MVRFTYWNGMWDDVRKNMVETLKLVNADRGLCVNIGNGKWKDLKKSKKIKCYREQV